jgi:anaerobic nitric oxide reductase transcription regulator
VRLSPEAFDGLQAYPWPGNVRELENLLLRATLKAADRAIRGEAVLVEPIDLSLGAPVEAAPALDTERSTDQRSLRQRTVDYQRGVIRRVLAEHGNNWAAAARALGMHRGNLHHLAARLGLK